MIGGTMISAYEEVYGVEPTAEAAPQPEPAPAIIRENQRVLTQYLRQTDPSYAWALALCKTSLGLPFESVYGVIWLFPDRSALVMNAATGALCDWIYGATPEFSLALQCLPDDFEDGHTRLFLR